MFKPWFLSCYQHVNNSNTKSSHRPPCQSNQGSFRFLQWVFILISLHPSQTLYYKPDTVTWYTKPPLWCSCDSRCLLDDILSWWQPSPRSHIHLKKTIPLKLVINHSIDIKKIPSSCNLSSSSIFRWSVVTPTLSSSDRWSFSPLTACSHINRNTQWKEMERLVFPIPF